MAQDEDIELKDLLTEALEKNGVLAKIRAQLRASIFMTLENENIQKHQNQRLKDVLSTRDGVLSFLLVQELIEFCNLIQTTSIFKAETGQGNAYTYEGRQTLLESFKLSGDSAKSDLPVLVHLVQLLIKLSKSSQVDSLANSGSVHDSSNERSYNESEGSPNVAQNNTFLVNSGRSDNYELSFVSDSESSVHEDKSATVLPLNLNNSTESNDSLSTEIQGKQSSKEESALSESSIKPDVSQQEHSDSISSVDLSASSETAPKSEKDSNKKSNPNSYSKYLSEKHKQSKSKSDSSDTPPVDNIMKHFINSNLSEHSNESRSDRSISEEIIKAFSDGNTWTDTSPRTESNASPPANILDDTLPESPETKLRVVREINHLKQQTGRNHHSKLGDPLIDFTSQENLKDEVTLAKNERNIELERESVREGSGKGGWAPLSELPTLVISKNTKILPCYLKAPEPEAERMMQKPLAGDPIVSGKSGSWPES